MGRPVKDYTGTVFGKLTALRLGRRVGSSHYWVFKCACGREVERIPSHLAKNTYNGCRECLKGDQTWGWQGIGELPKDVYNTIRHGAQAKNLEFSVSIEELWALYLEQNRQCKMTGWPIAFNGRYKDKTSKTASLDRIDSSKGYVLGNLQWVHRDINKLKKNLPDEYFVKLCKAVAKHAP